MGVQQLSLFDNNDLPVVNVSQVRQLSPFRYPGGKTWLAPFFQQWIQAFSQRPDLLVEPFAGGGIISLTTSHLELAKKCIMVEKDEEVAAVWKAILYGNWQKLAARIKEFNLTHETAAEVLENTADTIEEAAFKTILKNRISHGGILADGSGILKNGENGKGILSRWYPQTLANRIEIIASMRDRLEFFEGDAFDYIHRFMDSENTVFFVDPPYTASKKKAGRRLYRYSEIDHEALFDVLAKVKGHFILTYDFDENIILMAEKHGFKYKKIPMTGTQHNLKYELIISSLNG